MLWFQGLAEAPGVVRACVETWRRQNPAWRIEVLTSENILEFLPSDEAVSDARSKGLPLQAMSDIIRIALLREHGGVWVDATTYCLKPLDSWIDDYADVGFFAFDRPKPDRMISSWFLMAKPHNHIIEVWYKMLLDYWSIRSTPDEYFWIHRLFKASYDSDAEMRAMWDSIPKISADGPHFYVPYDKTLPRRVRAKDTEMLEAAKIPMLKLTHRVPLEKTPRGSVLRYICDNAFGIPTTSSRLSFDFLRTLWGRNSSSSKT
jgi:hypothetical protein